MVFVRRALAHYFWYWRSELYVVQRAKIQKTINYNKYCTCMWYVVHVCRWRRCPHRNSLGTSHALKIKSLLTCLLQSTLTPEAFASFFLISFSFTRLEKNNLFDNLSKIRKYSNNPGQNRMKCKTLRKILGLRQK